MEQLPKVVKAPFTKALQVSAEPHPDADVLTAFSERSLTNSERSAVLAHLSDCSQCRDIVFLSAPEPEAPAIRIRPASSWRPVFAWSGIAACVLIVCGIVLVKHENQNKNIAMFTKQEAAPSSQIMQRAAPVPLAQPNEDETKKSLAEVTVRAIHPKSAAKDSGNLGAPSRDLDARAKTAPAAAEESQTMASNEPVATLAPVPMDKLAPVSGGARSVYAGAQQQIDAQSPPQGGPSLMKESFADTANANSKFAGKLKFDASPRWTLNADGSLLRSVDTGASWKKIIIPGNSATLRTIATVGPEVWVGGTQGTLYHSADAGGHWMPVALVSEGQPLSDDVISIKFASPQQGAILTDHQSVWTTTDGGLTWNKK